MSPKKYQSQDFSPKNVGQNRSNKVTSQACLNVKKVNSANLVDAVSTNFLLSMRKQRSEKVNSDLLEIKSSIIKSQNYITKASSLNIDKLKSNSGLNSKAYLQIPHSRNELVNIHHQSLTSAGSKPNQLQTIACFSRTQKNEANLRNSKQINSCKNNGHPEQHGLDNSSSSIWTEQEDSYEIAPQIIRQNTEEIKKDLHSNFSVGEIRKVSSAGLKSLSPIKVRNCTREGKKYKENTELLAFATAQEE